MKDPKMIAQSITIALYEKLDLDGVHTCYEGTPNRLGDTVIARWVEPMGILKAKQARVHVTLDQAAVFSFNGDVQSTATEVAEYLNARHPLPWKIFVAICEFALDDYSRLRVIYAVKREGDGIRYQESCLPVESGEDVAENLPFETALEYLKDGEKVARAGWNGKEQYIVLIEADKWNFYQFNAIEWGVNAPCKTAWIGIKTADNKFVPWVCSQTDLLASDWCIVETQSERR